MKLKILIVEDEEIVRDMLVSVFRLMGFEFVVAHDGQSGLTVFNDNPDIDRIVTNFDMPGMNGPEFIRRVRQKNSEIHICLMSGMLTPEREREALSAGANEVMGKPMQMMELITKLRLKV